MYNNGKTVPDEKRFASVRITLYAHIKNEANEIYGLEMYVKCIINNVKPPQTFEFSETELSGSFIWFERFP